MIFKSIVAGQLITPDDVANDTLVQLYETLAAGSPINDSRVADLIHVAGSADLNLASAGDEIFLYDSTGAVVDSVSYGEIPFAGAMNKLKTANSDYGQWENYTIERVWTVDDANWAINSTGWAIKQHPTPGRLNGTIPEYGSEDPFGGGIPNNVVINEVFFGPEIDVGNTQINQFIDLFNPTDRNINVTAWKIETRSSSWIFTRGKYSDELGDSDILLIWPDNNKSKTWDDYMNPTDDYSSWWEFWNNVDNMETWYQGDDYRRYGLNVPPYTPPTYSKNHELHNVSNANSDFNLTRAGDFVILRDNTGVVVDVVCWGTGYNYLPADAKLVIDKQNIGLDHGISQNESLERIWQKHYPVCSFLSGPGVYHLPTLGKKIGQVSDEIEEGTEMTWDINAGSFTKKDSQVYGLEFEWTTDNNTRIDVAKYTNNPKDHKPKGLPIGSEGVAFWHFQSNNFIKPLKIWIYIDVKEAHINLTTLEIYQWDYANEKWDKLITTMTNIGNNITRVYTQTELDISESEQLWIGVFASSIGGREIPGFEYFITLIAIISLVYLWFRKNKYQL